MTADEKQLNILAERLASALMQRQRRVATAESCTGGWIAKILTDLAGSSNWFERGFVSYSNAAKQELLGVSTQTLQQYGAVSAECVCEMAQGALIHSRAHHAVAVSGIAGPSGGSKEKPVGTVWVGWARRDDLTMPNTKISTWTHHCLFSGTREQIRYATVETALQGLIDANSTQFA